MYSYLCLAAFLRLLYHFHGSCIGVPWQRNAHGPSASSGPWLPRRMRYTATVKTLLGFMDCAPGGLPGQVAEIDPAAIHVALALRRDALSYSTFRF